MGKTIQEQNMDLCNFKIILLLYFTIWLLTRSDGVNQEGEVVSSFETPRAAVGCWPRVTPRIS